MEKRELTVTHLLTDFDRKVEDNLKVLSQSFHSTVRVPLFEYYCGKNPSNIDSLKREFFNKYEENLTKSLAERIEKSFSKHVNNQFLIKVFSGREADARLASTAEFQHFSNALFGWRGQLELLQNSIIKINFYMFDVTQYFKQSFEKLGTQVPQGQIDIFSLMFLYALKLFLTCFKTAFSVKNTQLLTTLLYLFSMFIGIGTDSVQKILNRLKWASMLPLAMIFKTSIPDKLEQKIDMKISLSGIESMTKASSEMNQYLTMTTSCLDDLLKEFIKVSGEIPLPVIRINDIVAKTFRVLEQVMNCNKVSVSKINKILSEERKEYREIGSEWVLYSSGSEFEDESS